MRKTSPLDALLPRVRQALLAAILLNPARKWYLSDIARHLNVTPSSLQRELSALVEAGILRRRRDGNRIYYSSDPACPFLGELRGILLKTVGLVDIVKEALEPFEDLIEVAFIYGSMARGEESAVSDIDLMIIGEIRLAKLAPILRDMEKRLLKPINVVLYARDEFYNKARIGHHFIVEVLKSEKIFLRGNQHELDIASGRAEGKAAHHELQ